MRKVLKGLTGLLVAVVIGTQGGSLYAEPGEIESDEKIIEFIREINPRMAEQVMKLRSVDPAEYRQVIREMTEHYHGIQELKVHNPELAKKTIEAGKLEFRVEQLADEYRNTSDTGKRAQLRKEIKTVLTQVFEKKIALEESEANQIEGELKKLRKRIAQRKEKADVIVEKKLSELTADEIFTW